MIRRLAAASAALAAALATAACSAPPPAASPSDGPSVEAVSLLGEPLARPSFPAAKLAELEGSLAMARLDLASNPEDLERIVWVGRRLAYLGRYREAVEVYTDGLALAPDFAPLLRHRGHRWITLREFVQAEADLERARELTAGERDELELDGAPNSSGIPRSTLQSNIGYHLGLARYLQGDFAGAAEAWDRCLEVSRVNDDMLVATLYWCVQARLALGRREEALGLLDEVTPTMEILENDAYRDLLLHYRGLRSEAQVLQGTGGSESVSGLEFATRGYGIATWHRANGDEAGAEALLRRVVAETAWPAFGHIAAEADLARGEGK